MFYQGSLSIPAGTTAADPAVSVITLCYGMITQAIVLFPAGPSGLAHGQVWYHEGQILPTSPGESFVGDDTLIVFPERYPVHDAPFEVEIRGWAPDADLDHTMYVSLSVEHTVTGAMRAAGRVPLPEGMQV